MRLPCSIARRLDGFMHRRAALWLAACLFPLLLLPAHSSTALELWGEVFGGATLPISQDDNATGPQFGVRFPIAVTPLVWVEPFYSNSQNGSIQREFAGFPYERSGFNVHAGGANVAVRALALGTHVQLLPYAGMGLYHFGRPGSSDTNAGYNFGLQTAIRLGTALSVDVRGEFNMVVANGTSRKCANVLAGVCYRFYTTP